MVVRAKVSFRCNQMELDRFNRTYSKYSILFLCSNAFEKFYTLKTRICRLYFLFLYLSPIQQLNVDCRPNVYPRVY